MSPLSLNITSFGTSSAYFVYRQTMHFNNHARHLLFSPIVKASVSGADIEGANGPGMTVKFLFPLNHGTLIKW